ncbi:MAG: nucleosidase [Bacteroidia bacterium]|nr:nucleosidase [Bacteroidia bacterium]
MKKLIVVQALKEEEAILPNIEGYEVERIYTGCGKVASSIALLRAIFKQRPSAVINIGTVGAREHKVGDIVICNEFVDRDLNPLCIYGIVSHVTSDTNEPIIQKIIQDNQIGICSTGDSFVTGELTNGDVCDMEAFAQAMVCQQENIPFVAIKYVTDIVGENSVAHWEEKLADAREGLSAFLKNTFA